MVLRTHGGTEELDVKAEWKVTWFYLDTYYEMECMAPTESLAKTFTLRAVATQVGVDMRKFALIKTERLK